uniref:Pancreatic trypsin inhibitor n=1 Tax=Rhipicephalus appendiculatus TaxID=34631 RepID=A0A131YFJ5_RHIAP
MRILVLPFFACYNVVYFAPVTVGAASNCFRMPSEGDDCDTQTDRWYYNKDEVACVNFMYGDCPQGGNDFASVEECEKSCKGAGKGPPQRPLPPERPPHKGGNEPSKGKWPPGGGGRPHKPWKPWGKPPRPPKKRPQGPGEENETVPKRPGGGGWPRPGPRPRPRPPKPPSKRPGGGGSCAARLRRKKGGCSAYEGMWFNNGAFMSCSRVKEGYCPTVGSFFATCEECMGKCRPRQLKQCQYMT